MREERKPVMCPWCGGEMKLDEPTAYGWECPDGHWCSDGYICPVCGGSSGGVYGCATCEECRRLAYENATQKPPNKPMTLPELFDLADDDAAWVVYENGKIWAMGAECAQEWASEERCLFFANKPTNADIAAARKEQP